MNSDLKKDLDAWASAAKKHNLNYGEYVRLVEQHRLLPPPEPLPDAQPKAKKPTRTCRRCGSEFELHITDNGCISYAKLCIDCRDIVRSHNADGHTGKGR